MGAPDGANPYAGVIRDSAGNLYGTTYYGGTGGCGRDGRGCGVLYTLDVTGHESVLSTWPMPFRSRASRNYWKSWRTGWRRASHPYDEDDGETPETFLAPYRKLICAAEGRQYTEPKKPVRTLIDIVSRLLPQIDAEIEQRQK